MSLEQKAISALKWATAAKLVVQVFSWASTIIVVRLLTPDDYGLMAKVAVVCGIAAAIAELGMEAAIVRSPELPTDDLRRLYGACLAFAWLVCAIVVVASPLLAALFREPRLAWPIAAATLQIPISAAALVPSALATRDLSFRGLAKIEMAAGLVGAATTLTLAALGAGVWALVLGALLSATTRSAALLARGRRVRPLFTAGLRGVEEHLKFGLTLVGSRLSYFVVVQSDVLIGSSFLSTTEIGRYAVALQLATLPMTKVMGTINQITLPVVAQKQADRPAVREALLGSLGVIALMAFPVLWGISALAPEIVQILFGAKWLEAIPALAILPLVVPVRMICSVMFTTSLALGGRQLDLRNTVANFILLPTGFYVGAHWGLVGLCGSWLISVPLAYTVSVPGVMRLIGLRLSDLVREVGPPAVGAAVMYGAVVAARTVTGELPAFVALPILSVLSGATYVAVIAVVSRRHLAAAMGFVRKLTGRGVARAA